MFDIGFSEISLVMVLALLVFGPERLPELVRTMGGAISKIKKASVDIRQKMEAELLLQDLNKKVDAELKASGLFDSEEVVAEKILKNKGRFLKEQEPQ